MSDYNERKKYDPNESESKSTFSPNGDANINSNVEDDSGGGNSSFYSKLLRENLSKHDDNVEEDSESINSDYDKTIMKKNKKQVSTNEYQAGKKIQGKSKLRYFIN